MGVAIPEEAEPISMTLPADIDQEVRALSEAVNLDMQQTVATLLRYGLQAHREKQAKLESLVERFRDSVDTEEQARLGDQLGEHIFSR